MTEADPSQRQLVKLEEIQPSATPENTEQKEIVVPKLAQGDKTKKYHLKFPEKLSLSDIPVVIGLAYSSRRLNKITFEAKNGKTRVLNRPYVHVFIRAPKHSWKSTFLNELKSRFPNDVEICDQISFAGMIGSIDQKSGEFVPPEICEWGGKVICMDEIVKDRKGDQTRALLQLLEGRGYVRKLGRWCKDQEKQFESGAFYSVKDSRIECYSPFTVVMASMYSLSYTAKTQLGDAMLDRMWTVQYEPTRIERELMRDLEFEINFPICNPSSEVFVKNEDYEIIKMAQDVYDPDLNPRVLDNMVRAFAITGKHDSNIYRLMAIAGRSYWEEEK